MKGSLIISYEDLMWLNSATSVYNRMLLFLDLVNQAVDEHSITKKRGIEINLNPGQAEFSISKLSVRWNLSRKTISVFLDELEKRCLISRVSNKLTTIIQFNCLTNIASNSGSSLSSKDIGNKSTVCCELEIMENVRDNPPLDNKFNPNITQQIREECIKVFKYFKEEFPMFDAPVEYTDEVERCIFSIYIVQMQGKWDLLQKFLNTIKSDPLKNMALDFINGGEKLSFTKLFSSYWQDILGV